METLIVAILTAIVCLAAGAVAGYYYFQNQGKKSVDNAQRTAERIVADAETKSKEMLVQARDETLKLRNQAEQEFKQREREFRQEEDRLQRRRVSLDERLEQVDKRERTLNQRQSNLDRRQNQLQKLEKERLDELERVANMSQDEAKQLLLQTVEQDARQDMARVIREVENEAREEGERRAREIVVTAIQRIASDQVAEVAVSTVPLPSDDMKGRIIGRQGRNIRALENATGVDLVVDDTPEAVLLSCFDPVRREVARVALNKLILDGRIHPARIEKVVEKARDEVSQIIRDAGEQAAIDAGVPGLHPEIQKLLGRLKFRTSYGQNQLAHAVETAHIAAILAAEVGANVQIAKMGALLHDLGKAVDHEVEGAHASIGADLARRYGVPQQVVNCIAAHHNETETESLEAVIVEAADAISGARPGARRESLETYVKRIKALEEVASSFDGVAESYAIQAGREIRIIVKPEQIDDLAAIQLSKSIAKTVEENLQYPGQIKITVIRETRAVDFAK
ncbi:MAG: ribonuclease Y [Anaerolineaceae bacterium]|nr:ribonuclease Y [Anaerolineaceae bacterium]